MKHCALIIILLASLAFCSDRWIPLRIEYANSGQDEIGVSSGVWWSLHEDVLPIDAYGPTVALKALVNGNEVCPGMQLGFEANALFLCARMQCNAYRFNNNTYIALLNPQVGITWISLVNFYVGYNKKVSGTNSTNVNEVNMALCVNLPSYFFRNID